MWICAPADDAGSLREVMDACEETAMSVEVFCLTDMALEHAYRRLPANWTLVPAVGRVGLADAVELARLARPAEPAYGILPPGHLPRTRAWDTALSLAAGRWNVAYSNDLFEGGRHPMTGLDKVTGAVCLGGELVREMGSIIPRGLGYAEAAMTWVSLGRALGLLRYLPDVVVERQLDYPAGGDPAPEADELARARLFRWLNDEARPLIRRVRRAISREARNHENRAV